MYFVLCSIPGYKGRPPKISGKIEKTLRECFQDIIVSLKQNGAEGVILGCTEIDQLIKQEDSSVLVYDTACLHVKAAAKYALR